MKKYSYVQAAQLIPMNYKQLYDWRDEGVLDEVLTPPITKLSEEEIDYLRSKMAPPKGGLRMQDLKRYFSLSDQTLKLILSKYHIYPLKKHYSNAISVKYDYYDGNDLIRIQNAILDWRRSHQHKIQLIPNTTKMYNQAEDYNLRKLCLNLSRPNEKTLTSTTIYQWISYHRIEGDYSIDPSGKLFFTPTQFKHLKAQYKHIPDRLFGNNQELAKVIGTHPSTLVAFRKYYQIPVLKILGIKDVFYTKANAEKLIDWYHHRGHRPYPHHPTKDRH